MKTQKKKSSLPFLLIVLALLIIFLLGLIINAFIIENHEENDNEEAETIEVSVIITKETKAEISETTTEETEPATETTTQKESAEQETETTTEEVTEIETVELNFTQLYLDFFELYGNSVNKLTLEEFQQDNSEKLAGYDVQTTEGNENDLWSFTISDDNGNSIYMAFYANNSTYETPVEDWVWTLTTLSYNSNGNEISISDRFHINAKPTYILYDKNAETPSREVTNIDELKEFMFR